MSYYRNKHHGSLFPYFATTRARVQGRGNLAHLSHNPYIADAERSIVGSRCNTTDVPIPARLPIYLAGATLPAPKLCGTTDRYRIASHTLEENHSEPLYRRFFDFYAKESKQSKEPPCFFLSVVHAHTIFVIFFHTNLSTKSPGRSNFGVDRVRRMPAGIEKYTCPRVSTCCSPNLLDLGRNLRVRIQALPLPLPLSMSVLVFLDLKRPVIRCGHFGVGHNRPVHVHRPVRNRHYPEMLVDFSDGPFDELVDHLGPVDGHRKQNNTETW